MEDRLCAYSRAVAHFPTAVKEVKEYRYLKTRYSFKFDLFEIISTHDVCSSNGEMGGSIHLQKKQLLKANQIHVHYIQRGSKN